MSDREPETTEDSEHLPVNDEWRPSQNWQCFGVHLLIEQKHASSSPESWLGRALGAFHTPFQPSFANVGGVSVIAIFSLVCLDRNRMDFSTVRNASAHREILVDHLRSS